MHMYSDEQQADGEYMIECDSTYRSLTLWLKDADAS